MAVFPSLASPRTRARPPPRPRIWRSPGICPRIAAPTPTPKARPTGDSSACEVAAEEALGERALILRAGLLDDDGDASDRLTWWLRRIDEGGRIPAPAPWNRSVQIIDVRDAAAFAVAAAVTGRSGPYNVTGPDMPLPLLLETTLEVADSAAELVWVHERRAVRHCLTCRPLAETLEPLLA